MRSIFYKNIFFRFAGCARLGRLILPLLFLLFLPDCGSQDNDSDNRFWVINTLMDYQYSESAWYEINTVKKAENERAIVYVDILCPEVDENTARILANEFRDRIYPEVTGHFAFPYDVDGNGKTILVVFDIIDQYSIYHSGAYVGGYFWAGDFNSESAINGYNTLHGTCYHTNEADVLYIDCNPQDITGEDSWRTIAHEFQHLVNASYRMTHLLSAQDTWIDEGLAEAANHLCYGEITDRITYYNDSSDIKNGHPLFFWDSTGAVLANYAQSYLFFQFLRSHAYQGNGIFGNVLKSSYSDYQAVEEAMAGDSDLGSWNFNELLLRWHASNRGVTGAMYGYDSEISTSVNGALVTSSSADVGSGGGVVKSMGSSFNSPAAGFVYMSVNIDGTLEDLSAPFDQRDRFVAVYSIYDVSSDADETTALPLVSSTRALSGSYSIMLDTTPAGPQKIDLVFPASDKFIKNESGASSHE